MQALHALCLCVVLSIDLQLNAMVPLAGTVLAAGATFAWIRFQAQEIAGDGLVCCEP